MQLIIDMYMGCFKSNTIKFEQNTKADRGEKISYARYITTSFAKYLVER